MKSNVARRVLATFYRPASPRCSAPIRATTPATCSEILRQAPSLPRRTGSSYSISKTVNHAISRSFAPVTLLAAGIKPNSSIARTVTSTCVVAVGGTRISSPKALDRRKVTNQLQVARQRAFHSSGCRETSPRSDEAAKSPEKAAEVLEEGKNKIASGKGPVDFKVTQRTGKGLAAASVVNKRVMDRLPSMPHLHRPNKEELLAAATGFWSRLKVRFKWFSIRSVRPFNMDEIGAFFSWFVLGHVIWIIVGTTTFFSLAIFAVNTVFAQETLARWVGKYLTKSSGVKVVFESAIVPKWGDGVITFKNVFVSRRPGQGKSRVSKGSSTTAAAAAAAAADKSRGVGELLRPAHAGAEEEEEDTNYTQFDLSINTVNVTLSFAKWFNSKGLLRDVEIKGVRGVVDRTSVHYSGEHVDPRIYKHEHNPGDFEINSFKMEDLLVTIYQPHDFRPFSVSIFSCDLPQLRRQWLFYDFLSANTMSGSLDDSLFTIHPRQIHNYASAQINSVGEFGDETIPFKKQSRLRIDGLNIDHLNRGVEGPFSWIHEGNVDIVADIMFPADNDESIAKVMSDFYDRMEATVTSKRQSPLEEGDDVVEQDGTNDSKVLPVVTKPDADDKRFMIMDLRIHLNDVRAAVPLFTKDISYVKNALIRPIVAYINSRRTFIPINCRVVKRASEFDGSWTIFDSGLMDDLSAETYEAFARDVVDEQARRRRFKKVGLWSLQLAVQALFMGMAGNIA